MGSWNTVPQVASLRLSGPFSDSTLELVRSISVMDVAGSIVSLRPSGSRFIGLCPFHSERHPSFGINPSKNLWYCFGCGAGGDVIAFVMELEHCSFREAVSILAARFGISMEHGALDLERMAAHAELKQINARIKQIEQAESIHLANYLAQCRNMIRSRTLDDMPCDIFDKLRRADAKYVLSVLADEDDRLAFLSSSIAEQEKRIDEVLSDGCVTSGRFLWEVPLQ